MQTLPRDVNPFALMLDPQAVIAQIERSERLEGLHRRVCRPLDKPLLGGAESGDEVADGEQPAIDAATMDTNDPERDDAVRASADEPLDDCLSSGMQRHD